MNIDYTFICMLQAPVLYGHAHQASPTSFFLSFSLFSLRLLKVISLLQRTAKRKPNLKAPRRRRVRNQKVIQMRTSLVLQIIFWRFLAAAKTKTKKKKKGGTNYSKTSLICPSNLRALSLATQINILFLVSAYIYAGHRCVTCVFSMQPQ